MTGPGVAEVVGRPARTQGREAGGSKGSIAEDAASGGETAGYQADAAFDYGPVDSSRYQNVCVCAFIEFDGC